MRRSHQATYQCQHDRRRLNNKVQLPRQPLRPMSNRLAANNSLCQPFSKQCPQHPCLMLGSPRPLVTPISLQLTLPSHCSQTALLAQYPVQLQPNMESSWIQLSRKPWQHALPLLSTMALRATTHRILMTTMMLSPPSARLRLLISLRQAT